MKKVGSVIIFLFVILGNIFSLPFSSFPNNVSFYSEYTDVYSNPSAIAFRSDINNRFIVGYDYYDNLNRTKINEPLSFVQNSDSYLNVSFGGSGILFSAAFGYNTSDRKIVNDGVSYDFITSNNIQLDWGFNINNFAFGARIKGGSKSIRDNKTISSYLGIIQNFLFGEYTTLENSNYFNLGFGTQYHVSNFSFGLYTDSFLILNQTKDLTVNFDNILNTLSFGVSYRRDKYTNNGELAFYRPRFGFALNNIFSSYLNLELSSELMLQLLPNRNINLIMVYGDERSSKEIFIIKPSSSYLKLAVDLLYDKCKFKVEYKFSSDKDYSDFKFAISFLL